MTSRLTRSWSRPGVPRRAGDRLAAPRPRPVPGVRDAQPGHVPTPRSRRIIREELATVVAKGFDRGGARPGADAGGGADRVPPRLAGAGGGRAHRGDLGGGLALLPRLPRADPGGHARRRPAGGAGVRSSTTRSRSATSSRRTRGDRRGGASAAAPRPQRAPRPVPPAAASSARRSSRPRSRAAPALLLLPRRTNPTVHLHGSLLAGHGLVEPARVDGRVAAAGDARARDRRATSAWSWRAPSRTAASNSTSPARASTRSRCSARGGACPATSALVLELLVEMLRRPTFPAEELEKLRTLRLGELAQAQEDTFLRAFEAFTRLVYPPGHPYYRRPARRAPRGRSSALPRRPGRRCTARSTGRPRWSWRWSATSSPRRVASASRAARRLGAAACRSPPSVAPARPTTPSRARPGSRCPTSRTSTSCSVTRAALRRARRRFPRRRARQRGARPVHAVVATRPATARPRGADLRGDLALLRCLAARRPVGDHVLGGARRTSSAGGRRRPRRDRPLRRRRSDRGRSSPTSGPRWPARSASASPPRPAMARELVRLARHGLPMFEIDRIPEQVLATARDEVVAATPRPHRPESLSVAVAGRSLQTRRLRAASIAHHAARAGGPRPRDHREGHSAAPRGLRRPHRRDRRREVAAGAVPAAPGRRAGRRRGGALRQRPAAGGGVLRRRRRTPGRGSCWPSSGWTAARSSCCGARSRLPGARARGSMT